MIYESYTYVKRDGQVDVGLRVRLSSVQQDTGTELGHHRFGEK